MSISGTPAAERCTSVQNPRPLAPLASKSAAWNANSRVIRHKKNKHFLRFIKHLETFAWQKGKKSRHSFVCAREVLDSKQAASAHVLPVYTYPLSARGAAH